MKEKRNIYIIDNFNLSILGWSSFTNYSIHIKNIPNTQMRKLIEDGGEMHIYDKLTANFISNLFNIEVASNKEPFKFMPVNNKDELYGIQIIGEPLKDDAKELRENTNIYFLKYDIHLLPVEDRDVKKEQEFNKKFEDLDAPIGRVFFHNNQNEKF